MTRPSDRLPVRRTLIAAVLSATAGTLAATVLPPTFAQGRAATEAPRDMPGRSASAAADRHGERASKSMRDVRASKLIGTDVRGRGDEKVGEIKDLLLDVRTGQVRYAIVAAGGFLGMGDKVYGYPTSAFRDAPDRDELMLNVDKGQLKDQPGFDEKNWPNLREYGSSVDRFFAKLGLGGDRARRAAQDRAGAAGDDGLRRASQLIGQNVADAEGHKAGEIEDLVVSMAQGRVAYAVLDPEGGWLKEDKLLPMPLSAFRFAPDRVTLGVARDRIDTGLGFDDSRWPDLNDPDWRRRTDQAMTRMRAGSGPTVGAVRADRSTAGSAGATDTPRERGSAGRMGDTGTR